MRPRRYVPIYSRHAVNIACLIDAAACFLIARCGASGAIVAISRLLAARRPPPALPACQLMLAENWAGQRWFSCLLPA